MGKIKMITGVIYSIYAFLVFIILLLLIFPFVVVASFLGKVTGGNLVYRFCTFWADAAMLLWGMHHKNIYEAPHKSGYPVVFVFNHISYIDIPVLVKAFRRQYYRVLGKAAMASIPIFGFVYRNAAILVNRSSPAGRAKSVSELTFYLQNNISVVIAPEGTFNTTHHPLKDFYDGAFKIAIETQTPIKPVIFLGTYERLHYESIFSMTPGKTTAVFLAEVAVAGFTMDDVGLLKNTVYKQMEDALIRYKAGWIKNEY